MEREVLLAESRIQLTTKEYDILKLLSQCHDHGNPVPQKRAGGDGEHRDDREAETGDVPGGGRMLLSDHSSAHADGRKRDPAPDPEIHGRETLLFSVSVSLCLDAAPAGRADGDLPAGFGDHTESSFSRKRSRRRMLSLFSCSLSHVP